MHAHGFANVHMPTHIYRHALMYPKKCKAVPMHAHVDTHLHQDDVVALLERGKEVHNVLVLQRRVDTNLTVYLKGAMSSL